MHKHAAQTFVTLLAAACAASPIYADEVLVAEITNEFIYSDFTFGGPDSTTIFVSIWEDPTGDPSNIFNEVFVSRVVTEADIGTVFSADLNDPAQAAQRARLTNGLPDTIWFGADAPAGKSYESEPESALFTGQPGPAGLPLTGPDLANFTPTRVELELNEFSISSDSPFVSTVVGGITIRIYAVQEQSVTVDIGGANFWGLPGDPMNESRVLDLPAELGLPPNTPITIRAVSTDFNLTTVPPSLGYHAQTEFDFNNDGSWEFAYFIASFEFLTSPVTNAFAGLPTSFFDEDLRPFANDGIVRIGFVDHVADDIPDAPDAFIELGGTASFIVITACNQADRQIPLGVLDLADVSVFVGSFVNQVPGGDLAPPFGIYDLNDIALFVQEFTAGCP